MDWASGGLASLKTRNAFFIGIEDSTGEERWSNLPSKRRTALTL